MHDIGPPASSELNGREWEYLYLCVRVDEVLLPGPTAVEQPSPPPDAVATPAMMILVDRRRVAGPRLRFRVFERDNLTCRICGRSPQKHNVVLMVDHIVPSSRGGLTVLENSQAACEDCNRGKSDSIIAIKEESCVASVGCNGSLHCTSATIVGQRGDPLEDRNVPMA
jgi:hypothetical protein